MFKIAKKVNSSTSVNASSKAGPNDNENNLFLKDISVFILSNGMGKNRVELFRNALIKSGANIIDEDNEFNAFSDSKINLLILVDESTIKTWCNLDKALLKKKFFSSIRDKYSNLFEETEISTSCFEEVSFRVVTSMWLSECLRQKSFICTKNYEIRPKIIVEKKLSIVNEIGSTNDVLLKRTADHFLDDSGESDPEDTIKKKKINSDCKKTDEIHRTTNDSSYTESEEDNYIRNDFNEENNSKKKFTPDSKTWTCAHSSKEQSVNQNKYLTDKLESILSIYETTNDKYRALSYQKAISALKRCPNQIKTKEVNFFTYFF